MGARIEALLYTRLTWLRLIQYAEMVTYVMVVEGRRVMLVVTPVDETGGGRADSVMTGASDERGVRVDSCKEHDIYKNTKDPCWIQCAWWCVWG